MAGLQTHIGQEQIHEEHDIAVGPGLYRLHPAFIVQAEHNCRHGPPGAAGTPLTMAEPDLHCGVIYNKRNVDIESSLFALDQQLSRYPLLRDPPKVDSVKPIPAETDPTKTNPLESRIRYRGLQREWMLPWALYDDYPVHNPQCFDTIRFPEEDRNGMMTRNRARDGFCKTQAFGTGEGFGKVH